MTTTARQSISLVNEVFQIISALYFQNIFPIGGLISFCSRSLLFLKWDTKIIAIKLSSGKYMRR